VPDPLGLCRIWGESRTGWTSVHTGVFQHMALLPDGSGVVFEVTTQFSLSANPPTLPPQGEGIFFVRANGSGLRRLGPAGRHPVIYVDNDNPGRFQLTGITFPVSPNGRKMGLIDLGPDTAGHEAPQIFLLDLRSGRRRQLTHQSRLRSGSDPGIWLPSFLDNRTIGFYGGSWLLGTLQSFQVKTDGGGLKEIPAPTLIPGARIVPQFAVTGTRSYPVLVTFPDKEPVNPTPFGAGVTELFLVDGKNLLQLTDFGRSDTGTGYGLLTRGRVLFAASANPTGENPAGSCQFFSINTHGGDLRQLTHLPADRPSNSCVVGPAYKIQWFYASVSEAQVTGTVVFESSSDPVGGNPFGDQLFAMGLDGSGLRQLTATRGMTTDSDGTVHVEMPGPWAYSGRP
jgi:hypothetical protein